MSEPIVSTHAAFDQASGELKFTAPLALCPANLGKVALPPDFSDALYNWSVAQRQFVFDLPALQAKLISQTKLIGERLSMRAMSAGGSKKKKYSSKEREILAWYNLGPIGSSTAALLTALGLLSPAVQKRLFRYALAEVAVRGGTVATAIARFEVGWNKSEDEAARLEALEQKAIAAIEAASSAAAKQAAFDGVAWNVSAEAMQEAMRGTAF